MEDLERLLASLDAGDAASSSSSTASSAWRATSPTCRTSSRWPGNTEPGSWSTTPTASASSARTAAARPSTSASKARSTSSWAPSASPSPPSAASWPARSRSSPSSSTTPGPLIFSAAATPASVSSVLASSTCIETQPERRGPVSGPSPNACGPGFRAMGYDTGRSQTPIIPVLIGDDEKGFMLWRLLREEGIFTTPVDLSRGPPRPGPDPDELRGRPHRRGARRRPRRLREMRPDPGDHLSRRLRETGP